jgi:hypothetical protein
MGSDTAQSAQKLPSQPAQLHLPASSSPPRDRAGGDATSPTRVSSGGGYKSRRTPQEWIAEVPGQRRMRSNGMEKDAFQSSRSRSQRPENDTEQHQAPNQSPQQRLQDHIHSRIDTHASWSGQRSQTSRYDSRGGRARASGGQVRRDGGAEQAMAFLPLEDGGQEQLFLRSDSLLGDAPPLPSCSTSHVREASSRTSPSSYEMSGILGFAPNVD